VRLDQTRIAIRERGQLEILDLALKVAATNARPLLIASGIGILPIMFLNWWLIGWMPAEGDETGAASRYLWNMAQLVFIEAPLASVPATLFLGQAMFLRSPRARDIAVELRNLLPRMIWCQVLLRGIALAWLLVATIEVDNEPTANEFFFLPLLSCYVIVLRALRPFVNEIVLLERNPMRRTSEGVITVRRRSAALHKLTAGDLMARWFGSAAVAIAGTLSVTFTIWFFWGTVWFDWTWGPLMLHVFIPLAMWLVACYFSVVRFLSYLDLRIRREGWEVELTLRAAAERLTQQTT
jgi:hypothetical protein